MKKHDNPACIYYCVTALLIIPPSLENQSVNTCCLMMENLLLSPPSGTWTHHTHPSPATAPLPYWPAEAAAPPPYGQPGPWWLAGCAAAGASVRGQAPPPERSRGRGGRTRSPRWRGSHNRSTWASHWPWWPSEHRLTSHCRERESMICHLYPPE